MKVELETNLYFRLLLLRPRCPYGEGERDLELDERREEEEDDDDDDDDIDEPGVIERRIEPIVEGVEIEGDGQGEQLFDDLKKGMKND